MNSKNERETEKETKKVRVDLWDGQGSRLANVWGEVRDALLDGKHDDGDDDVNANVGHHPEGQGANQLIAVSQILER